MKRYVLAVDPGLATGIALIDREDLSAVFVVEGDWYFYVRMVAETLRDNKDNVSVVCEAFRITQQTAKMTQAPWSLELIGMLKLLCWQYGYPESEIVMQSPGDAKAFTDNAKLKKLGWWQKKTAGHGHDAARHAALYLLRTGVRDPILL